MPAEIAKKTPLHDEHVRLGARMMEFGGWSMPVQFRGIIEEHRVVRSALGLFDISHMGQVIVTGPAAAAWLNHVLANNIERIAPGESQYTFLLNENGGVIDDLIAYHLEPGRYLLVLNAALTTTDIDWMQRHIWPDVVLENRSAEYAGLAIQGPYAARLFDAFFGENHSRPGRNEISEIALDGFTFLISRTGYTGEDGFEIFFPAGKAVAVWQAILERGAPLGIQPCGLGARDTLRLEMCYPLNGSDLSPEHTPLEAGLSIFVDLQKPDFIGRDALLRQREEGVQRRLVPFRIAGKSPPPRAHYTLWKNGAQISEITSGTLSPSLDAGIGMAYIPAALARIGEEIEVDIRGRRFPAIIEKKPLHKKSA